MQKALIVLAVFLFITKIDTVMFKGRKCDVFQKKDFGFNMTWFVHIEKPYPILYMRIKTPEGRTWRLYNKEELK